MGIPAVCPQLRTFFPLVVSCSISSSSVNNCKFGVSVVGCVGWRGLLLLLSSSIQIPVLWRCLVDPESYIHSLFSSLRPLQGHHLSQYLALQVCLYGICSKTTLLSLNPISFPFNCCWGFAECCLLPSSILMNKKIFESNQLRRKTMFTLFIQMDIFATCQLYVFRWKTWSLNKPSNGLRAVAEIRHRVLKMTGMSGRRIRGQRSSGSLGKVFCGVRHSSFLGEKQSSAKRKKAAEGVKTEVSLPR